MLEYAESLVDGTPTPVRVAGVIASDHDAAQELRAMRTALELVAKAPELEPSEDLTRTILLQARKMREPSRQRTMRYISAWRGLVHAAAFTVLIFSAALVVFGVSLRTPSTPGTASIATAPPAPPAAADAPQPTDIGRTADEVQALSAAVRAANSRVHSPERAQHLRNAVAADSDLAAALAALDKNPGSARATHIIYKSLQQQAESLREFYLDRSM
jgi:hypothetical protein